MLDKLTSAGDRFFSHRAARYIVIILLGAYGFWLSHFGLTAKTTLACDFQWTIKAAEYLLQGINPYYQVPNNWLYPYDSLYLYPLPTALVGIPFTYFDPYLAGAVFFGLSSLILAYAIVFDNWHRLPVFFSMPFIYAAVNAQWTPLILAAALLPERFRVLAFLKPTTGMISWIYRPSKKAVYIYAIIALLSLIILPTWPLDWVKAVLGNEGLHRSIILVPYGFLMLLSVLAIKTREGRTLLAASIIPRHVLWYDGPMIWLVTRNLFQSSLLTILSWIAWLVWMSVNSNQLDPYAMMADSWRWQVLLMYLPALIMVMWPIVKKLMDRPASS